MQGVLTSLFLPPLLLALVCLGAGLLAWQGRRGAGALAALAAFGLLLLATPFAAGHLTAPLEARASAAPAPMAPPGAIVVLGGEMAYGAAGPEVGPLTLERLRAAAALHRRTGLPLLVTGGPLSAGAPPIAVLMAASLAADFGTPVRWVEPRARDTRENALFAAAMLRAERIDAALVVSHAWHLPRALAAFERAGFMVGPAPVRIGRRPAGVMSDWVPRPDHLARSWFAIREWAGLLVYRLRDG
ncbi:YdcF family protein [Paracraurococcus lichenis]|uniref:YdcF family protein n=1 Tax=Paracraurococcus lichenis TaxID=3064888 RepID=A0ABT9E703_9PROT|nr:YdcF family protein [Paracraurococcus sp. LOR1-02]MDO9711970.1 YdcF family protein [Paracraurococcus sp. LOR1-02]